MILDKLHIAGIAAGLGLGALLLTEYAAHVKADAQAQATISAQASYQKELAGQLTGLQKQMADRDAAYQASTKDLNSKFADAAKSQAQMAVLLSRIGNLPVPLTVTVPTATKENPAPAPVVTVPQQDFSAVTQYAQTCEQAKLDGAKCNADFADTKTKLDLQVKSTASVQKQLDAAKLEIKGGTVWTRVKHDGKLLAIGGAVAITVACALGHCPK